MQSSVLAAPRRLVLFIAVLFAGLAPASLARAADPKVTQEAKALQKKAIEEDYLNVDYAAAVKNLKAAIAKCDGDKCEPALKAALLRDLGAMQVLGGSTDEGKLSFTQAVGIDATLELDPSYKNAQLSSLWDDIKKSAAAPPSAPPTPPPAPAAEALPQSGDFAHATPAEALVRTPLALYVEYGGTGDLAHVVVKYKSAAMTDWKSIELQKLDRGYGSLLPCSDVTAGTFSYYLQGFNAQNDQIAASGSRSAPLTFSVKAQIAGTEPSLPGQPPPSQCAETGAAECPPDFPGCKAGTARKDTGADCVKDAECKSRSCTDGKCAETKEAGESCQSDDECGTGSCSDGKCIGKKGGGDECESSDECESGRCDNSKCTAPTGVTIPHRWWVGVGVQLDLYVMPAGQNVCVVPGGNIANSNTGYDCVDSSGNLYPSTPALDNDFSSAYDRVDSGLAVGNIRILASLDYAISANMMAGVRAGYVARTDPVTGNEGAAFIPLHAEARYTYLFGHDVLLQHTSIAPMVFAGVGVGEFDAYVPVTVERMTTMPLKVTENAWQTAGPLFVSAGGGVRAQVADSVALSAAIRLEGAFGGSAGFLGGFAPELGVQFGL